MVAKTGLVVRQLADESKDRWKSDRPGTQILYNRGFRKRNRCGFFLSLFLDIYNINISHLTNYHIYNSIGNDNKFPDCFSFHPTLSAIISQNSLFNFIVWHINR